MHRLNSSRSPRSPVRGAQLYPRNFNNSRELALKKLYVGQDPHIDSICCIKCAEIPNNPRECNTCGSLICLKCSMTRAGSIGHLRQTASSQLRQVDSKKHSRHVSLDADRCYKTGCQGTLGQVWKIHSVLQQIMNQLLFKCPNKDCDRENLTIKTIE